VRSRGGQEAYAQLDVRGATEWKGEPAFDLEEVPGMILDVVDQLQSQGWSFDGAALSFAVRQHDMVLLDRAGQPAMPALSWQCNAASKEVEQLRQQGAEDVVGRIEERFILPKLKWALRTAPKVARRVDQVMTTGDWIAYMLTGQARLSTSDAISNALLVQKNKNLAASVMRKAKVKPAWFPKVIQSGRAVGRVTTNAVPGETETWQQVKELLEGATIVAGLGDNHATGVGCGLDERDFGIVVVSAGTSGTINRVCPPAVELAGAAACFEYYKNRLLLMMLADCCKWYDRFVDQSAAKYKKKLSALNAQIDRANLDSIRRVLHRDGAELFTPTWKKLSVSEKAASTQFSITLEFLLLVRAMLDEVGTGRTDIKRFVLTGGLSQSPFVQQVFYTGVQLLAPKSKVLISARKGPLRYQTAAYGALLNAMRPKHPRAAAKLCPTKSAARPTARAREQLEYLLQSYGM
jgi:sugar (pentulose or hexulose) kinase